MIEIKNKKEFERFYYFKGKPTKYPKEYPCICKKEDEDAGISGSVMRHYVMYYPKNLSELNFHQVYRASLKAEWEYLC